MRAGLKTAKVQDIRCVERKQEALMDGEKPIGERSRLQIMEFDPIDLSNDFQSVIQLPEPFSLISWLAFPFFPAPFVFFQPLLVQFTIVVDLNNNLVLSREIAGQQVVFLV
ncbi:MAG: hypothetical protein GY859_36340 [Desulfobacterales bacterium]|nr:hypothetical protein [Desulfobacterales bacterium]